MRLIQYEDLLACLECSVTDGGRYTLPNLKMQYHRIYGGQLIAQAIVIAAASAPGKSVTSVHSLLVREGDAGTPVDFEVGAIQDGRSFAARTIVARQAGRVIYSAQVSLRAHEEGLEHQVHRPDVGGPDDASAVELSMIPWETRSVAGVDLSSKSQGLAEYSGWMRAPSLDEALPIHQALLAHSATLCLLGTALRPFEGLSEVDVHVNLLAAATSHTIWFHRPLRVDAWLLLHHESPTVSGARGFGTAHVFGEDGALVASFAQESLLREIGA